MSASLHYSTGDPPGPRRRRADLVPCPAPQEFSAGGDRWLLGVTDLAHLPASQTSDDTSPRPEAAIGRYDQSQCGVFVTQVPAGPATPHCPTCTDLRERERGQP